MSDGGVSSIGWTALPAASPEPPAVVAPLPVPPAPPVSFAGATGAGFAGFFFAGAAATRLPVATTVAPRIVIIRRSDMRGHYNNPARRRSPSRSYPREP